LVEKNKNSWYYFFIVFTTISVVFGGGRLIDTLVNETDHYFSPWEIDDSLVFLIHSKSKGVRAVIQTKLKEEYLIEKLNISGLNTELENKIKNMKFNKIKRFVEQTQINVKLENGVYKLEITVL